MAATPKKCTIGSLPQDEPIACSIQNFCGFRQLAKEWTQEPHNERILVRRPDAAMQRRQGEPASHQSGLHELPPALSAADPPCAQVSRGAASTFLRLPVRAARPGVMPLAFHQWHDG